MKAERLKDRKRKRDLLQGEVSWNEMEKSEAGGGRVVQGKERYNGERGWSFVFHDGNRCESGAG